MTRQMSAITRVSCLKLWVSITHRVPVFVEVTDVFSNIEQTGAASN